MKKLRTSVIISPETLEIADSIAEADDRSRSWVFTKSVEAGLPSLDSEKAREIRAKKKGAKKEKQK